MPVTSAIGKTKPAARPSANGEPSQLMTAEEFIALPDGEDGCTYELVQGVLVVRDPAPGPSPTHSAIQANLCGYLHEWMRKFGHGAPLVELVCLLGENLDTVRKPDVAVLLQPFDAKRKTPGAVRGAPDIAIEVLSPSNKPKQIRDKTTNYFAAGALRVWIVDPETRTVVIHKPDGTHTLFMDEDMLEDPEILPGFSMALPKVFELPF